MLKSAIRALFGALLLSFSSLALAGAMLIKADTLNKQMKDDNLVLIDMSDDTQYQRFHLPGAVHLPFDMLVVRQNNVSTPVPQDKLIQLLGKLGISNQSSIVIYDDLGGLNASRLYWELEQLGHSKVAILDGGLVTWILEGRGVTNRVPAARKPTTYAAAKTGRPLQASLQDVAPESRAKNVVLLDVRTEDEYKGNPKFPRSGHIPGAKWWEWDQAVKFDEGFVQQDDKVLRDSLAKLGVKDSKQPIITYCRSSHRASQSYYTLKRLGFENVKIYTGSMLEYEQQKQLPLTMGGTP